MRWAFNETRGNPPPGQMSYSCSIAGPKWTRKSACMLVCSPGFASSITSGSLRAWLWVHVLVKCTWAHVCMYVIHARIAPVGLYEHL